MWHVLVTNISVMLWDGAIVISAEEYSIYSYFEGAVQWGLVKKLTVRKWSNLEAKYMYKTS